MAVVVAAVVACSGSMGILGFLAFDTGADTELHETQFK